MTVPPVSAAERIRAALTRTYVGSSGGWRVPAASADDASAALDELLAEIERLKELKGDPMPVILALGETIRRKDAEIERLQRERDDAITARQQWVRQSVNGDLRAGECAARCVRLEAALREIQDLPVGVFGLVREEMIDRLIREALEESSS